MLFNILVLPLTINHLWSNLLVWLIRFLLLIFLAAPGLMQFFFAWSIIKWKKKQLLRTMMDGQILFRFCSWIVKPKLGKNLFCAAQKFFWPMLLVGNLNFALIGFISRFGLHASDSALVLWLWWRFKMSMQDFKLSNSILAFNNYGLSSFWRVRKSMTSGTSVSA